MRRLELLGRAVQRVMVEGKARRLQDPSEVAVRLGDVAGGGRETRVIHAPLGGKLRIGQLDRCGLDPVVAQDEADTLPIRIEQHPTRVQKHHLEIIRHGAWCLARFHVLERYPRRRWRG